MCDERFFLFSLSLCFSLFLSTKYELQRLEMCFFPPQRAACEQRTRQAGHTIVHPS